MTAMGTKIAYYPGCTLKTKAEHLERPALACLTALGVEVEELQRWNCCGAVFSLAADDLIRHVAPVRVLIRAKDQGCEQLMTLCSLCYNTLARANLLMAHDDERRATLNRFMDEETDYFGEVTVLHYLDLLRDQVGWDRVAAAVKVPLTGLRVASYYGCTLLRPPEVAIDEPNGPTLFDEFVSVLGAVPVDFPAATACCGSYQVLTDASAVSDASARIVASAQSQGADVLVLSCPVCDYNIGHLRPLGPEDRHPVPSFYFTQLLALALGLPVGMVGLQRGGAAATEYLVSKGLLGKEEANAVSGGAM